MPKVKSKDEAVKQVTKAAELLKKSLREKYGGDYHDKLIGKGELKKVLGSSGERFKDVVMLCCKKFNITKFSDIDGELEIQVIDVKKPLFKVRDLRRHE